MTLKQTLNFKLSQQLAMTPQLQQAIRLLQLSTLELQAELQSQMESNLMLEVEEENSTLSAWGDLSASFSSQNSGHASASRSHSDEDFDLLSQKTETQTLNQHMLSQILLIPLSDLDRSIAIAIIDSIDEQGYFRTPLNEFVSSLQPEIHVAEEDVLPVLHLIQHLDPAGIAAQNLQECLLIQLNAAPHQNDAVALAKTIVSEHLTLCAEHNYSKLMKLLAVSESTLRQAIRIIKALNPRPGSQIAALHASYIIPDVLLRKRQGQWLVELNPAALPKVRINGEYAALVRRSDSSRDHQFLKNQLQEARWLIKSLESRNDTLLRVAQCIVEQQLGFFEKGDEALRPMILHDVAEALGLHESTISRITTQKYIHSPRGIFELKYFFSSHVSTDSGGECSSRAIRSFIKKLVTAENPNKPLSDQQIAQLLEREGIQVARRTIAKYRDQLQIPSSAERKKLKWVEQT